MIAILLFLNARGPARYHIGYPTLVRASAGIYGSLIFVFIRGVSSIPSLHSFGITTKLLSGRGDPVHEYPDILRQRIPSRYATLRIRSSMD
jgi:hypothetical protein